ncbi:MAG: DMT family transporter [Prevotella sp.]|nr:DMT family transporter [Prevotellaceae bacterium]MDY3935615.1 DMT family transporter [Prevotella sp.]
MIYHIIAIAIVMVWGGTFVNTKKLAEAGLNPESIFLLRFGIAYISIWFISPLKLFCRNWRDELWMFLLGIFGGSFFFFIQNYAIDVGRVTDVSFIVCTTPLVTVLLAILIYKSVKGSWLLFIGSFIALFGVGVVVYNGQFVLNIDPLGHLLALAASVSWAIYSLILKKITCRYSPIFVTRKIFFYGIITILPVFIVHPWNFPLSGFLDAQVWGNCVFLGFVASFLCFFGWNWVIEKLGALKASNYLYLNPVTTMLASLLFLDEPITVISFIGSLLILIGVFIANKSKTV